MSDIISKTRANRQFTKSQLRQLEQFGSRVNKFGANFAVCNGEDEPALLCETDKFKSSAEQLIEASRLVHEGCCENANSDTVCTIDNTTILAAVLKSAAGGDRGVKAAGVALIDLGEAVEWHPGKDKKSDDEYHRDVILSEMLTLFVEKFHIEIKAEEQIEMVSTELAHVYEELVLLHKLSTNMKVTEPDTNFLQMACDNLTDIVLVEGIAILLEKTVEDESRLVLAAGAGLIDIDEQKVNVLHSRLVEEIGRGNEALLDSEVDSPFKYEWPAGIKNIIAVPLCGKDKTVGHSAQAAQYDSHIIGLMVAINRIDKPDFDSIDAKLFNSVAGSCAVFVENGRLFAELKELLVGSLKALTNSIDAKDQYTRGHSERVAFISRWIAERLAEEEPLEEEQIHKIYLAGLLHDIGKMGIDEAVLRKEGKLTDQELNFIRVHPSIGAGILGEIKQMREIVPGVLCHHERVDGGGYPNGLAGEQIPLIGKIVGLADSFDAMTSKRTYRDAMSIEDALREIEKGLGRQFDERVGRIFINSDVYRLWDIMLDGFSEMNKSSNLSEYGTVAVGSIIR